jgi:hypothetical protein
MPICPAALMRSWNPNGDIILNKMEKPFRTDWRYFWKGVWNILVKRARSK